VAKLPSFQFYPGDWLRDGVAGVSLAAQGLWLRLMILMHDSPKYGYLCNSDKGSPMSPESAARRCGCTLEEYEALMRELDEGGIPSRTPDGCVYSRRMVRDEAVRVAAAARQRKHRTPGNGGGGGGSGGHARVTSVSRERHTPSSSSSSRVREKSLPTAMLSLSPAEARQSGAEGGRAAPAAGRSKFSIGECRSYADALADIKSPAAFAKSIWRSGEDDALIAEFLERGGHGETEEERRARITRSARERLARSARGDN
jgi:hypothetical protein